MTVVECFDRDPLENIASCLSLVPDTLVFVGNEEKMQKYVERYKQFFKNKNINTEIILCHADMNDINSIVDALDKIITPDEECVLDMSGGDGVALAAAGAFYEKHKAQYNISLQQFNILDASVSDLDGDHKTVIGNFPKITVKELISLYGGKVATKKAQPDNRYTVSDISSLWKLSVKNKKDWNKKLSILNEFEKHSGAKTDALYVSVNYQNVKNSVKDFDTKKNEFLALTDDLHKCGAIKIHNIAENILEYSYQNALICDCLNLAGNLLEYKTLFEGRKHPLFNDCLMSVNIDWDGVLNPDGKPKDTFNEIDCIFMHGLVPLFISCKNGEIKDEEIYKLNTVAERFGGKHAKKLLVSTNAFYKDQNTLRSFKQRASDTGIVFEADAATADWHKLLSDALER